MMNGRRKQTSLDMVDVGEEGEDETVTRDQLPKSFLGIRLRDVELDAGDVLETLRLWCSGDRSGTRLGGGERWKWTVERIESREKQDECGKRSKRKASPNNS